MTYATRFTPRGFAVCLMTDRDGGPFACEFTSRPNADRERVSRNAQYILWRHVASNAPRVYADAVALGWVPDFALVTDSAPSTGKATP